MTTYETYKSLIGKKLDYDDYIYFTIKKDKQVKRLMYSVTGRFLSASASNSDIFTELGMDCNKKVEFAKRIYCRSDIVGVKDGSFPEYNSYIEATNIVLELFKLCENGNYKEISVEEYLLNKKSLYL